jgi:ribose-phosphate pyrophosphokinase
MGIFINSKAVDMFKFSAGECHVKIFPQDIKENIEILANLYSSDDVMSLLLLVDAIRRISLHADINLTIPYFPYARQDRVCNVGEALSVKVMADIINSLNCTSVTICDPHSDVTPALLNHCRIITLAEIVANSFLAQKVMDDNIILVSPDAGAEKKVYATAKKISSHKMIDVLCARKTRDTLTGNITSTEIYGEVENKNLMILDDICDGGQTFIELAKLLKQRGAKDIYLYVTHGIFSKGLVTLQEYFKHIYCYHTLLSSEKIDLNFLTIISENK